jgi:DNA-binding SARP family transcriptional activator/tetratricopeptide (TPR) repeat protein
MKFRILGPLDVRSNGQSLAISGNRQQRLLALLLLDMNHVIDDERLIRELWATPPSSARQQLHNAIGNLRRALAVSGEETRITRANVGYRLEAPPTSLDMQEFRSFTRQAKTAEANGSHQDAVNLLQSGLGLWRGDALAGLEGGAITAAATNLNEQRLSAIEDSMSLRLKSGEGASLIGQLRQLVAANPLRETLRGQLMQALSRSSLQADALTVYDEGRRILAEELGIDPSRHLRELHASILTGEADTANYNPVPAVGNEAPAKGDIDGSATLDESHDRFYLPHDIGDFSGRETELSRLFAATRSNESSTLVISAIDGMGGVGKTTLAVHLAHRIAGQYPDGQYFIDLHGFSAGVDPVTPEHALATLLRDSGVPPELVPPGVDARSALWRSKMAGRRMLLVLDNAVDAQHVRPLLPATAGQLVLVTSRRRLAALDGAVPLSLDVLPQPDAIALFNRIAGRPGHAELDEVTAVVELCGRLPLAIRIAAARLRSRPAWTVSDLAKRLSDQEQRTRFLEIDNHSVATVLRLSYRHLKADQQRVFRLLGAHPGPDFDAHLVAAITGLPVAEAEYCLDSLYDDNLVKQRTAGRFYFHDLIKDCAQQIFAETTDSNEQRVVTARLFDYFLHCAVEWCRHLDSRVERVSHPADRTSWNVREVQSSAAAVETLHAEYENFISVARLASRKRSHGHAWRFPCVLQPLLRLRNNYGGDSYSLFQDGLRAAQAMGDVDGEMSCLQGLASICRERKSTTEAVDHLQAALKLSRDRNDHHSEASQLLELGNIHVDDDRLGDARDALLAARQLMPTSSREHLSASIANNLGVIYRDLGDFDSALHQFRDALATFAHEDHPRRRVLTTWCIGTVLHYQGDHSEAIRQFDRVLKTSSESGFEHGRALGLLGLADAHRRLGTLDESVELGRQALSLARNNALWKIENEALCVIGEAHLCRADEDNAEKSFEFTLERAVHYQSRRYQARALEGLAHIAMAHAERPRSEQLWQEAVDLYPDGMVDAEFARRHLASALADMTCFRCSTAPSRIAARSGRPE